MLLVEHVTIRNKEPEPMKSSSSCSDFFCCAKRPRNMKNVRGGDLVQLARREPSDCQCHSHDIARWLSTMASNYLDTCIQWWPDKGQFNGPNEWNENLSSTARPVTKRKHATLLFDVWKSLEDVWVRRCKPWVCRCTGSFLAHVIYFR